MQKDIKIWLDCDPGLDDTLAIILAACHVSLKLIGVSTSGGNTDIENTTKNALDILFNIKKSHIPVIRGSETLIAGQPHLAEHMHGSGGLGGVKIQSSDKEAIRQNPFQVMRDMIMGVEGQIVWANTGALTNLCWLFRHFPEVKQKISKIVIMGGAIGLGNITPAAEFNIFFDPEAYKEVLATKGDIPLVMIPLELTHEVRANQKIFQFLQQYCSQPFALALLSMLRAYKEMYYKAYQFDFPPVHDPCVIYYILHPEDFKVKKAIIDVDTCPVSYGRTNCHFKNPKNPTAQLKTIDLVGTKMERRGNFWAYFREILEKIFDNHS